jgi:hypothetical protein
MEAFRFRRPGYYFLPGNEVIDPEDGVSDLVLTHNQGKLSEPVKVELARKNGSLIFSTWIPPYSNFDASQLRLECLPDTTGEKA